MARKHTILDHPIIGYFVLFIFVMLFSSIGASLIDTPLSNVIPGYAKEMSGFGTSVTSAIGIVTALILLSPKNYPKIMELWKEMWSLTQPTMR